MEQLTFDWRSVAERLAAENADLRLQLAIAEAVIEQLHTRLNAATDNGDN